MKQAPGCGVRLSSSNDSVLTLSQPSVECRIAKFRSVINSPVTDLLLSFLLLFRVLTSARMVRNTPRCSVYSMEIAFILRKNELCRQLATFIIMTLSAPEVLCCAMHSFVILGLPLFPFPLDCPNLPNAWALETLVLDVCWCSWHYFTGLCAMDSQVTDQAEDYLPASQERRAFTLMSKRKQYADLAGQFFSLRNHHSGSDIFLQIQKDLLRMPILHRHQEIFDLFERVLFIWSVRHPGSGYVQGINDLLTPFFVVFLSDYVKTELTSSGELNLSAPVEPAQLAEIEADVFWCLSRLLDTIQDNYTFAQPGIQNNIAMLTSLTERLDADLHQHFLSQNLEYLQFCFRWMNNLLIRELPLRCIIRLWDTYLAEPDGFSHFHVYVCAAFLMHFADELKRQRDFQSLMLYLQRLPTQRWGNDDVQMVLAEAFRLKSLFFYAPKHLDYRKKDIA
ncbi:unnamed protein product [Schistocephalus solidus]|uniref:Rab-GAP TBC domain-containing protein n=2 Tax=Schistocephalus solidus TaxID=70667 RepID=A0A183SRZ0_SCHSO|nr:unnamed protein product [Schistocephalus solidus]